MGFGYDDSRMLRELVSANKAQVEATEKQTEILKAIAKQLNDINERLGTGETVVTSFDGKARPLDSVSISLMEISRALGDIAGVSNKLKVG